MRKPMTEARLAEIRAFLDRNPRSDVIAVSINGAKELLDYIDFLRECIAKAPHGEFCASRGKDQHYPKIPVPCDCWQREALGGGE